jgi:hypothetical protein
VWLDFDLSGKALADAMGSKFKAAVPVFFSLCRRLRLARLDLVFNLANLLVFSLLYGSEFLRQLDVIQSCEKLWWSGVRSFYGLPSGVSSAFIRLIFPRFSLVNRVLDSKHGLLVRGTHPLATLFPEALVFDRVFLFGKHRRGFSQIFHDWCEHFRLLDVFFSCDRSVFKAALQARLDRVLDEDWLLFSSMSSTRFASSIFCSRQAVYFTALEASRLSRLGVRIFMLAVSGSLSISYCKSRHCCACGLKFDFQHFLSCSGYGPDLTSLLISAVSCEDWQKAAFLIIGRFQVFVHAFRAGELTTDESELFDALNDAVSVANGANVDISFLFQCQAPN